MGTKTPTTPELNAPPSPVPSSTTTNTSTPLSPPPTPGPSPRNNPPSKQPSRSFLGNVVDIASGAKSVPVEIGFEPQSKELLERFEERLTHEFPTTMKLITSASDKLDSASKTISLSLDKASDSLADATNVIKSFGSRFSGLEESIKTQVAMFSDPDSDYSTVTAITSRLFAIIGGAYAFYHSPAPSVRVAIAVVTLIALRPVDAIKSFTLATLTESRIFQAFKKLATDFAKKNSDSTFAPVTNTGKPEFEEQFAQGSDDDSNVVMTFVDLMRSVFTPKSATQKVADVKNAAFVNAYASVFKNGKDIIQFIINFASATAKLIYYEFTGVPYDLPDTFKKSALRILKDLQAVKDLQLDNNAIAQNPELITSIAKLATLAEAYKEAWIRVKPATGEITHPPIMMAAFREIDEYTQMLRSYESANQHRIQPVGIYLEGPAGVGKSTFLIHLATVYARALKTTRDKVLQSLSYDKYWEGYHGHYIFNIDDIFQDTDIQKRADQALVVIHAINSAPYPLPMATLQQKGNVFFNSKIVTATSNCTLNSQTECGLVSNFALMRRFGIKMTFNQGPKDFMRLEDYKIDIALYDITKGIYDTKAINVDGRAALDFIFRYVHNYYFDKQKEVEAFERTVTKPESFYHFDIPEYDSRGFPTAPLTEHDIQMNDGTPFIGSLDEKDEIEVKSKKPPPAFDPLTKLQWQKPHLSTSFAQVKYEKVWDSQSNDPVPKFDEYEHLPKVRASLQDLWPHYRAVRAYAMQHSSQAYTAVLATCLYLSQAQVLELEKLYTKYELPSDHTLLHIPFEDLSFKDSFKKIFQREEEQCYTCYYNKDVEGKTLSAAFDYIISIPPGVKIIAVVIGSLTLVGASYTVYRWFSNDEEDECPDEPNAAQGHYNGEPITRKEYHKVRNIKTTYSPISVGGKRAQVTIKDDAANDVVALVKGNVVKIALHYSNGVGPASLHGLMVEGRLCLTTAHFLVRMESEHFKCLVFTTPGEPSWSHTVQADHIAAFKDDSTDTGFILITDTTFKQFRNISRHFLTEKEISPDLTVSGVLVTSVSSGIMQKQIQRLFVRRNHTYVDATRGTQYILQRAIFGSVPSVDGDCGSPWIANNSQLRHKLIGIHVSGGTSTGACSIITQEMIAEAMLHLNPQQIAQVRDSADYVPPNCHLVEILPNELALRMPDKTKIIPNPLALKGSEHVGLVAKPFKAPAVLAPRNGVSPMKLAVQTMARNPGPPKRSDVWKVTCDHVITTFAPRDEPQLLSLFEALNTPQGMPFLRRVDLSTSDGHPFCTDPNLEPGKRSFMVPLAEYLAHPEKNPVYFELVSTHCPSPDASYLVPTDLLIEVMKQLIALILDDFPYKPRCGVFLKDELLKLAKIAACKTRIVSSLPVHVFVLSRIMFSFILNYFFSQGTEGVMAVGINPLSRDWKSLFDRLSSCSPDNDPTVLAQDVDSMDKSQGPHFKQHFKNFMSHPMNLHPETAWECPILGSYNAAQTRKIFDAALEFNLTNEYIVGGRFVIATPDGKNPSGALTTTLYNTCSEMTSDRYAIAAHLQDLERPWHPRNFENEIESVYLGDDNVLAKTKALDFHTLGHHQKYIAELGLSITDHNKLQIRLDPTERFTEVFRNDEWVPMKEYKLSQVQFLKRSFTKVNNACLARLDLATIDETMNWMNRDENVETGTHARLRSCAIEWSLWGENIFEDRVKTVNTALVKNGFRPLHLSYLDTLNGLYLQKHQVLTIADIHSASDLDNYLSYMGMFEDHGIQMKTSDNATEKYLGIQKDIPSIVCFRKAGGFRGLRSWKFNRKQDQIDNVWNLIEELVGAVMDQPELPWQWANERLFPHHIAAHQRSVPTDIPIGQGFPVTISALHHYLTRPISAFNKAWPLDYLVPVRVIRPEFSWCDYNALVDMIMNFAPYYMRSNLYVDLLSSLNGHTYVRELAAIYTMCIATNVFNPAWLHMNAADIHPIASRAQLIEFHMHAVTSFTLEQRITLYPPRDFTWELEDANESVAQIYDRVATTADALEHLKSYPKHQNEPRNSAEAYLMYDEYCTITGEYLGKRIRPPKVFDTTQRTACTDCHKPGYWCCLCCRGSGECMEATLDADAPVCLCDKTRDEKRTFELLESEYSMDPQAWSEEHHIQMETGLGHEERLPVIKNGANETKELTSFADTVGIIKEEPVKFLPPIFKGTDPYPDQGVTKILSRPYLIKQIDWSTSDAPGTLLHTFNFPNDLINIPYIKEILSRFRLFRAGVCVEFRPNSTQFHSGQLMVCYVPHANKQNHRTALFSSDMMFWAQGDHTLISANTQETTSISLPYVAPSRYFDLLTPCDTGEPGEGFIGQMYVYVLHQLALTGVSTVSYISLACTASFIDPEPAAMTIVSPFLTVDRIRAEKRAKKKEENKNSKKVPPPIPEKHRIQMQESQEYWKEKYEHAARDLEKLRLRKALLDVAIQELTDLPLSDEEDDSIEPHHIQMQQEQEVKSKEGVISRIAMATSRATAKLTTLPIIGNYMSYASPIASAVADLAKSVGLDKPTSVEATHKQQIELISGLPFVSGLDNSTKLSTDPQNQVANNNVYCAPDYDIITNYIGRPGLIRLGTFDSSTFINTIFEKFLVSPTLCPKRTSPSTPIVYYPTPLAQGASKFRYWSGPLKFKVLFTTSSQVATRIRIEWHYDDQTLPPLDGTDSGNYISMIVDIKGDTSVCFSVPYLRPAERLIVPTFEQANAYPATAQYANGQLVFRQVNPPVAFNSVASTVVKYAIWIAGSAGTQLERPTSRWENYFDLQSLSEVETHTIQSQESEFEEHHAQISVQDEFKSEFSPLIPASTTVTSGIVGGDAPIVRWSEYMHRAQNYNTVTASFLDATDFTVIDDFDLWNPAFPNDRSWWGTHLREFLFHRGSLRLKIWPTDISVSQKQFWDQMTIIAYNMPLDQGEVVKEAADDPFVNIGSTFTTTGVRPMLEIEIPFYGIYAMRTLCFVSETADEGNFAIRVEVPYPVASMTDDPAFEVNLKMSISTGDDYSCGWALPPPPVVDNN